MSEPLKAVVEAALLAATQPLTIEQLGQLYDDHERPSHEDFARTIEALSLDCAERGIELKEVASGFRYQVRSSVHARVARLWTERQTRYTRATLETLALIAYRQPITRGEIEAVRGVSVSTQIVKSLEEREWIRVVGHREVPGRPALYATTKTFLDYFNLRNLDELPTLAELRELAPMEPELDFDGPPAAALPNRSTGTAKTSKASSKHAGSESEDTLAQALPVTVDLNLTADSETSPASPPELTPSAQPAPLVEPEPPNHD
jgi:segregation and condensation protein B